MGYFYGDNRGFLCLAYLYYYIGEGILMDYHLGN